MPDRPSPSQSASKTQVGTIMKGNNGKMWIVVKLANGTHRWVPYKEQLKLPGKAYIVHDNGGRPFKVYVTKSEVIIVAQNEETRKYDKRVLTIKNYSNIFIGKPSSNSILVEVRPKQYVFIGMLVYSFKTEDRIIKYMSPIGRNDVPYPYAIGEKYTYLMIEFVKIENEKFKGDPYQYYYFDISRHIRKKIPKFKFKLIHDRIW